MTSPPRFYVRPPSAMPRVCAVCGGSSDLAWHPYEFQFATPVSALAVLGGIAYVQLWRMSLPACGPCRARARWGGFAVVGGAAAGAVVGLLILTAMAALNSDSVLLFILALLLPLGAGAYLGNRRRGRIAPRVLRANREELIIAIPGRAPLRLVHSDPAKVDWTPEAAVA